MFSFFSKTIGLILNQNKTSIAFFKGHIHRRAPVFPTEAEIYCKAFPNAHIEIVYGSTEAEPISSINANELLKEKEKILQKGLKVGLPYRKIQVKIIDITDEPIIVANENELIDMTLSSGKIGEIIVSGQHVLREYFNNDIALKQNKIFIGTECWHRTGDSGYLDESGVLYLTGRCNTLIDYKGLIITPFFYENYFQSIESVEIGTILKHNNCLFAILQLKEDTNKIDVLIKLEKLDIKFDQVKFVAKIPRDPRHNSKIDYMLLSKQYLT